MLISYDTETDDLDDVVPRTCLIQISEIHDRVSDVLMFEGLDCFAQFFQWAEERDERLDVHAFNLDYEFSRLWKEYLFTPACPYKWTDEYPKAGEWHTTQDKAGIYSLEVRGLNNRRIVFTDDARRFPTKTMSSVAEAIRSAHPDWWETEEVKEEVGYNDGWFEDTGEKGRRFRHYAAVDAYSQARIMRYTHETGQDITLTAASHGLKRALAIAYGKGESDPTFPARKKQLDLFTHEYPPLPGPMQEIAEASLVGGYVWGSPGIHRGTFVHIDYSSSYPAEYHHGKMFRGPTVRCTDPSQFKRLIENPRLMVWIRVSFDFTQPEGRIAVISGQEIDWSDHPLGVCPPGAFHNKVMEGHIEGRLYTLGYWNELQKHVRVENVEVSEVWYSKAYVGRFAAFIETCYRGKSEAKAAGNDVLYDEWKRLMNSGIHGKTITKTHRFKPEYLETGERRWIEVVTEPRYDFLIGFTAMENARERLLRHCRMLEDAGHKVLMCDTDSIVCAGTEEQVRECLGPEWFITKGGDVGNLGKFEFEEDSKGRTEFPEFKCWGLKRYLEIDPDGSPRKSAFAGMRRDAQFGILIDAPVDGTDFSWDQFTFSMDKYGKTGKTMMKKARLEDVIWTGTPERRNYSGGVENMRAWWAWFKDRRDWSYDV